MSENPLPLSALEEAIFEFEKALERHAGPSLGSDPNENIKFLNGLLLLDRFRLEAHMSTVAMVSLSDEDYGRLQEKMRDLIQDNQEIVKKKGIDLS